MNNSYRIERLSFSKLADIEQLYQAVYNKAPATDLFKKKYDTAFTGVQYTGFLAYGENNEPAAFYGVIPCFIQHNGEHILAAQSADTMTHPGHRNKGLFVQLAQLTYEVCSKESIRILFGFPNQNSQHGFINKLDWQMPGSLESFNIPVNALPLQKIALKFPALKNLYNRYVDRHIKELLLQQAGIANSVIKEGFTGVYRDEAYFKYKTYSHTRAVKIGPASVWFKIQNGLVIGDIIDFEDNFDNIIMQLKQLARKLGLSQLHFQAGPQAKLYNLLRQYAEPTPSFQIIIKDLSAGLQVDKIAFTLADIDIF